jgi:hypothetical protein
LVREIPKLSKESKGGHPVDLMDATDENPCCEFAWSPTPVEAIVHSQPDLNDVMRRGEETRG